MSHVSKRCRISEMDRLPDSLLVAILSRLGLKEAAKTAAVSKQWRFLWTNVPLMFKSKKMEDRMKFVDSVRTALLLVGNSGGSASHTPSLCVIFHYSHCFASDVDSWLDFAVKNKVKDLSLYLNCGHKVRYTLPQSMFSNSSLTKLDLIMCLVEPQTKVDWPCLKKLTLNGVKLRQLEIEKILWGCPVLEWLELDVCDGNQRLEIPGRSLEHLSVILDDRQGGLLVKNGCRLPRLRVKDLRIEVAADDVPSIYGVLDMLCLNLVPMSTN